MKKTRKPLTHKSSLFVTTLILVLMGVISVANVSAPNAITLYSDKFYFAKQHIFWAIIGISSMVIVSRLHPGHLKRIAVPLYIFSLFLLIAVLIPGIGSQIYGARRWIIIGGFSLQPAEFAKIALAIYLAKVASSQKGTAAYVIPIGITSLLVLLQPDLGTTLVIVVIGMSQVFISGVKLVYVTAISVVGAMMTSLIIIFSDYRRQRLYTFFQQTSDPLGEGYHVRQILLALASGGMFGIGLGQSRQKFLFLPEVCTDSVFAIIAEEMGFIGTMFVLAILFFYIYQGVKIIMSTKDAFNKVLAVGITTWIGGQMFLNIGSMVALVPLTGIPLPFLSCGGSSLVMICIATGILLSILRFNEK